MVKLPPWDTPAWRLARELRPLYAAVNRVQELEATPDASLEEIASAQRAVAVAAAELMRLLDAMRLFKAKRATVSGERDADRWAQLGQTHYRIPNGAYEHHHHGSGDHHQRCHSSPSQKSLGPVLRVT